MSKLGLEVEGAGNTLVMSWINPREGTTGVNGIQYDGTVIASRGGGRLELSLITIDYTTSMA